MQREIYRINKKNGFHETNYSFEHFAALITTEIAELIEADRNARRAKEGAIETAEDFENKVKGSVEEELADIAIRILDTKESLGYRRIRARKVAEIDKEMSFTETAYRLTALLHHGGLDAHTKLDACHAYVKKWAELLGVNLDYYIRIKIKYNATRSYKHGKAY